jgi:hypothetical protein
MKLFIISKIKREINIKNSPTRKIIALILRTWRITKYIDNTCTILNRDYKFITKMLEWSRIYRKIKHKYTKRGARPGTRRGYKAREPSYNTKHSELRNKIASCLKIWKNNHSIKQTANELDIDLSSVQKFLVQSKFYINSKYREQNYNHKFLFIKHSHLRNRIALFLKTWIKCRSFKKTARLLGVKVSMVNTYLNYSSVYKKRKTYSRGDLTYITKWARKIWAINQMGGKCAKCGENNIFVLDFHHKNYEKKRNNKKDTVSNLIQKKTKINVLKREMTKCILLCRNCHAEIHHANAKNNIIKRKLLKLIKKDYCENCNYKNIPGLEFHHIKNKRFEIGKLIGRAKYCPEIYFKRCKNEAKKCKVLCCNCHAKEQVNIKRFKQLVAPIYTKAKLINEQVIL